MKTTTDFIFPDAFKTEAEEYIDAFQAVLDILPKKGSSKTVDYLIVEAITLLLKEPDFNSYRGIRD